MKLSLILTILFAFFIYGCANENNLELKTKTETQNLNQVSKIGTEIGSIPPDFVVVTTEDNAVRLRDFQENRRPVIVYFMATWCPFCKHEYEEISKAYPQYSYKVDLVSVSIDLNENAAVLEKYRIDNNRPGIFAPGSQQILENYNVLYTTTKYAIDKNGVIVYKRVGEMDAGSWKTMLEALS